MTADVIDLHRRRIDEVDRDRDAIREASPKTPRPKITPDDPIFALFDAYKEAQRRYEVALSERAHSAGLPKLNMAALLRAFARKQKAAALADLHDLPDGVLPI